MADTKQAKKGDWPWGKEKQQEESKTEAKKSGSTHDDAKSNTTKSAKDVPRSTTGSEDPIRMKDGEADEQSEHYTTEPAKSAAPSKGTHMTNGANGTDGEDKESSVNNPLNELQAGLKAGKDDSPTKADDKDLKEVDPQPLSDEEMKKLTPGDGLDEPEISAEPEKLDDDAKDIKSQVSAKQDEAKDKVNDTTDDVKDATDEAKPSDDVADKADDAKLDTEAVDDNISTDEVKPDDSISRVDAAKSDVKPDEAADDLKEGVKNTEETAEKDVKPEEAVDDVKEGVEATEEDATKDKKPEETTEELKDDVDAKAEDAKPDEAADDLKEGVKGAEEDAEKEGEALTKEGEDVDEPEAKNLTKEGEDVVKDGEEATKDATDEVTKEGEDVADEATKEGDDVVKEGEEAAKDATDETEEAAKLDFSILRNGKVNKGGNVIVDGKLVGRVTEGILAQLVGKQVDENGVIWNSGGKRIGKAEPIPDDEREGLDKASGPFEAFTDAKVDGEGFVIADGEKVGKVVEGDLKRLRGMSVDPDGDILDRAGSVIGKAERWEPEPEPEKEPEPETDYSSLSGKRVNKAGNIVDSSGAVYGRVVEGDVKRMVGRMCNAKGEILSENGEVLGRGEVVPEGQREGVKEGPFAELSGCTVAKDGTVVTPSGDIVGRLIKGDGKVLFGRSVDEDGDVLDKNGNSLGKAERWEPEPEPERKKGPLEGRRVNREGNVVDEDGNVIGKLTSGDLSICAGKEIDGDGDVLDSKKNVIGHCNLIQDIPEPKAEESPEDKEKREKAEQDKKLAQQMAYCLSQCLDKVKPICSNITSKIEAAERTPKEELDEEQLVKEVRPLIEQGGRILDESNGIIRGLDPDGRIQRNAKHKAATHEATPEEHHLAEILKELTGTVTQCIENAKKKLEGMPHAKKELSPLWGLLSEPLFQILAAVGLLLNGVLGLVGRLLSGLGLGGLVDSLLGGLGVKNILEALGVGSLTDSLTGKNQKGGKKSGGLLGLGG